MTDRGEKLIADNRRARHDYHLLDRVEAGLVLTGTEVKSLRDGRASLQQAYADVRDGEAWLVGAHIDPYDQAGGQGHEPERDRKLLLHRRNGIALQNFRRQAPTPTANSLIRSLMRQNIPIATTYLPMAD